MGLVRIIVAHTLLIISIYYIISDSPTATIYPPIEATVHENVTLCPVMLSRHIVMTNLVSHQNYLIDLYHEHGLSEEKLDDIVVSGRCRVDVRRIMR